MKESISQIIDGKRVIIKKPELLAPAGNLEKLKVAVTYGADAVFVGGKEFSLRSLASNFSIEDIKEAASYCHDHGASLHVTTNIILHEDNLEGLKNYLYELDLAGIDAIIAADPCVLKTAMAMGCRFEKHLSTQMSTSNSMAVKFWQKQGVDRVVLAREVTYPQLCDIIARSTIDIEYFIHGAMCINVSGRCMLSNDYSRRDANRGGCSQSCRWFYDLNDLDGNQSFENPFTMSSKDLESLREIPKLIESGVASLKIEGRMKSVHYIATVVSCYRKLIDAYCANPDGFVFDDFYEREIMKAANRSVGKGFFYGNPNENCQLYQLRDEHPTQDFVMRVLDYNNHTKLAKIEQRNHFKVGQKVEFFSPSHDNFEMIVTELYNEMMEPITVANHPMEVLYIKVSQAVNKDDMARKV